MSEERLQAELEKLENENAQLRAALASRIVVERATGVLMERLGLKGEQAFTLLRAATRRAGVNIGDVAVEILRTRLMPAHIEREIAYLLERREAATAVAMGADESKHEPEAPLDLKTPCAERHERAARRHDESAARHEQAVQFWEGRGDDARAELARRHVAHERRGAELERDIALNDRDDPLRRSPTAIG